nr:universal stress protein [Micromonospora provocatoris]
MSVSGRIVEGSPVEALLRVADTAFLIALGEGACPPTRTAYRPTHRPWTWPPGPVARCWSGGPSRPARPAARRLRRVAQLAGPRSGYAFDCAQHRGARLLAVQVIEPESGDRGDGRLEEAVTRTARRYPRVAADCETVHGDPKSVLLDRSRAAQLAVVAAWGDGPVGSTLGAVSQSLLYHSPAPLIVVRGVPADTGDGS